MNKLWHESIEDAWGADPYATHVLTPSRFWFGDPSAIGKFCAALYDNERANFMLLPFAGHQWEVADGPNPEPPIHYFVSDVGFAATYISQQPKAVYSEYKHFNKTHNRQYVTEHLFNALRVELNNKDNTSDK